MDRATNKWLAQLPNDSLPEAQTFARRIQKSYVLYGNLLLLPSNAFTSTITDPVSQTHLPLLYSLLSTHLKITHIAITRPIPSYSTNPTDSHHLTENVIRSPINFTPLYGSFGPSTATSPPTSEDFEAPYWASVKQNGIQQVWAPRWTMLSRGNVSEKARLLCLPSVLRAVEEGRASGMGCSAVDLYVGIGYFAFSYVKAGFAKVVGWDLNPWSIEGLRRGAVANHWGSKVVAEGGEGSMEECKNEDVRLIAFCEDNARASERVARMGEWLPPVRHVSCGLLPTSKKSWRTAVEVLDERFDGWLHVHENFAVSEIEQRTEEVRVQIERLSSASRGSMAGEVVVEHVNRLKSYAPGVIHCVIDIHIPPSRPP